MKKWQKTVLVWDIDNLITNIPLTDCPKKWQPSEKFHILKKLRINSEPERVGFADLHIARPDVSPNKEGRAAIIHRLTLLGKNGRLVSVYDKEYSGDFGLTFSLKKEQFCDSAIEVAKGIFEVLGIQDKDGLRIASFFTLQETLVWMDGQWSPFANYLRYKHGLNKLGSVLAAHSLELELRHRARMAEKQFMQGMGFHG